MQTGPRRPGARHLAGDTARADSPRTATPGPGPSRAAEARRAGGHLAVQAASLPQPPPRLSNASPREHGGGRERGAALGPAPTAWARSGLRPPGYVSPRLPGDCLPASPRWAACRCRAWRRPGLTLRRCSSRSPQRAQLTGAPPSPQSQHTRPASRRISRPRRPLGLSIGSSTLPAQLLIGERVHLFARTRAWGRWRREARRALAWARGAALLPPPLPAGGARRPSGRRGSACPGVGRGRPPSGMEARGLWALRPAPASRETSPRHPLPRAAPGSGR